jgi:hypothetical protein
MGRAATDPLSRRKDMMTMGQVRAKQAYDGSVFIFRKALVGSSGPWGGAWSHRQSRE